MATTKTAEVLLKYKVDASSANRVSDSFEDLIAEITDLNSELARLGRASATGVSGITRELPKAESGIVALQDEVIRLRKELLALDNVDVTPTVTVGGSGAGGTGALNAVDRFGTIGSQVASGLGNGAVGQAAGLLGDVAGAVATMNPFLIAGAVAIGGVSLAMQDLANKAEQARAAAEAYAVGQEAAIDLIESGASYAQRLERAKQLLDEITSSAEEADRRRADIAANDLRLQEARNAYWQEGIGGLINLQNLETELGAANEFARGEITRLTGDIGTASAEFLKLSENLQRLAPFMTALNAASGALSPVLENIAAGFTSLVDKARSLPGELAIAGESLAAQKAADAADATAARSAQALKLKNSVNETTKAQAALITAQDAYNEAIATSRQKIADLNEKLQTDIAAAGEERRTALLEAERDAGEQRVKIAEDNAKELSRIQRRFDRSYAQAVGDRDALAAARAEQQKEDELKDLDERYKDQTKSLDDNLKNQQRIIEQRYDAQVRTARAAAEAAIRLEQQRAQAEINLKEQAVQAAINALVSAQNAENSIRASFYNQAINDGVAWANQMRFLTAYGFTIGSTTGTKQPGMFPGKAGGGPVGAGMPYVVGERGPEVFVPNVNGTIMPNRGGAMFTVNFEGATGGTIRATSKAQAIAVLDKVLTGMGAA